MLGTASLDGSGKATLTTSKLAIGAHSVTVSYGGDADIESAASAPAATVSVAPAGSHVVLVLRQAKKRNHVAQMALEAGIEPSAPGVGVPTGMVTFELVKKNKKPKVLGMFPLSGGTVTIVGPKSLLSQKLVEVMYSGDPDFQPSTSTTKIT